MRRLAPEKVGAPTYRQVWRVVDGAVATTFAAHPEYLARGIRLDTVRNSIVKRVTGAITGYAEQSAWVRSGSSPADDMASGCLGSEASSVALPTLPVACHGHQAGGEGTRPPLSASEAVRSVADDRLAHGDRLFGIAISSLLGGGTLVMLGAIALRHTGLC